MTKLAGRYEVDRELGVGGMGRVVVAHDHVLGRDVAVKLLSTSADETARERFMREARSAARLHHPNAVAVYDTGEDDGQPYLVMELVRGRSLADLLDEEGQVDVDEAIGITVGVLEGLEAAHRAGMIHRDVKPSNVLLPDEGGVKLSDFGIAKALDDGATELTAAGSLMGTPTYLAPELVGGAPPSAASDVYSVGCLLYAQLTGSPPFTKGEALAVAYAHRNEPVPPISDARPDLPEDLVAVVDRALAKDPAERYETAAQMRTALLDGPAAGEATGAATVAIGGAGAGAGRDRTQVLDDSDNESTRVVGAPAAAAAAPPAAAAAPARGAEKGQRWWMPVVIGLAVVALLLFLWWLLTDDGEDLEEPEQEPETEVDEPVDTVPDDTPDDDPGPPEEEVEEEPEEEPEPEPGPPDDQGPPEDSPGQGPPEEDAAEEDVLDEQELSDDDLSATADPDGEADE